MDATPLLLDCDTPLHARGGYMGIELLLAFQAGEVTHIDARRQIHTWRTTGLTDLAHEVERRLIVEC